MKKRRRLMTAGAGAIAVAAQCLLVAGVADATGGGVAEVNGSVLSYTAALGDANDVHITVDSGMYLVTDIVAITPGPQCFNVLGDTTKVRCTFAPVASIKVTAGDKDDKVRIETNKPATLYGGAGYDHLVGGDAPDTLSGGDDLDWLVGGGGPDHLYGGAGPDTLAGADGDDVLFGGTEADILYGLNGNDTLNGDSGNDSLYGQYGNDTLNGGSEDDWLSGGPDTDFFFGGADTLNGGTGNDTVSYTDHSLNGVHADPDGDVGDDGTWTNSDVQDNEGDTIATDVENITGGAKNDSLTGNDVGNVLDGGPGINFLDGMGGTDTCLNGPNLTNCEK